MLQSPGPILLLCVIKAVAQSGTITLPSTTVLITTGTATGSSNISLTTALWMNSTMALSTPSSVSTSLNETFTFFPNATITSSTANSTFIGSNIITSISSTLNTSTVSTGSLSTFGTLNASTNPFRTTDGGSSTELSSSDTTIASSSFVTSNRSSISTFPSNQSTTIISNSSTPANATSLVPPLPTKGSKTLTNGLPTFTTGDMSTSDSGQTPTIIPPPGQITSSGLPPAPTTSYSDEEIDSYLSMTSWDWNLVTSTLTSDPTISGTSTSNSEWKKNFWLKTKVDGKPTDLPVIHCGCICKNNCDSDNRDDDEAAFWIVYFNVPKVPNIQISLSKLPDFHLGGCMKIKVPIININIPLGKCPPVSDNGKNGHKDPDDSKDNNKDTEDPTKSTTISSSSSSSCSGAVVTDSVTQIVCPSASASDCQTTIQTSTRSGCSLTEIASVTRTVSSCSGGVVTDALTRISCPTSGATGSQCITSVETGTRSGCSLSGTVSVTSIFSAPACLRQSWPTSWPAGTGYRAPGSSYGTYIPPDWGLETATFSSMSANESVTQTETTTGPPPTTLSTITIIISANFSSSTESGITTPISETGNDTTVSGTSGPTLTDNGTTVDGTRTATEQAPPEETPEQPHESPTPTKVLTIVFESDYHHTTGEPPDPVTTYYSRAWIFYVHNVGDDVGCFDIHAGVRFEEAPMSEVEDDMPDWPANPLINDENTNYSHILPQGCFYRNDGTNAGRLFCPNIPGGGVNCNEHEDRKNPDKTYECNGGGRRRLAVECKW